MSGQGDLMAEVKKIREENSKMQETMLSALLLSGRSDNYGMIKEFIALQAEVKQMKEDQEKQKIENKKVCDELTELKKKQGAQELKLENHDDSISICKKMPVEELLVGKWKMASSIGREEYEKHRFADGSYSGGRAKIDFENREFTYDDALRSYVDNNIEDPSFKSDYSVNYRRRLVYGHRSNYTTTSYQWTNAYIEKKQLVVVASFYKDSKLVADCQCYYDRV